MRVRELRREKNLTIARLAKASGLSKGHVSNMEHGLVLMTLGTIVAIAKGLEIPPFLLILFPEDDPIAGIVERVRVEQGGDPVRAAQVLRQMVFGRGGPKRPPPDKGGGFASEDEGVVAARGSVRRGRCTKRRERGRVRPARTRRRPRRTSGCPRRTLLSPPACRGRHA
ncbi:helix-turn-helix domain-containing protein [Polyangium aurulentum]|nr:helix-turn-helix domain-containing protein [Polyangium aurulentum]